MATHSALEIAAAFYAATGGAASIDEAKTAAAIGLAESGGIDEKRHTNAGGSVDRGVMQINNRAHPDVSDACAADFLCNMKAAAKISNNGKDFTPWSTYTNGMYKTKMNQVNRTVNGDTIATAMRHLGTPLAVQVANAPADAVKAAVKPVTDAANAAGDFFGWISSTKTWVDIGKGVLGVSFILVGTSAIVYVVKNQVSGSAIGSGVAAATSSVKSVTKS